MRTQRRFVTQTHHIHKDTLPQQHNIQFIKYFIKKNTYLHSHMHNIQPPITTNKKKKHTQTGRV